MSIFALRTTVVSQRRRQGYYAAMPFRTVPELLSPAGDWDAMRAAVANGANAVYFGLENFNARHRATNFKLAELRRIIAYLHEHNVRGFVTFNTLIFTDELPAAADYITAIAESGVDAVIVQDLGLARLIHQMAPTLAIHGSTQMTLTEPMGIEFVRRLGIERVVLARELSVVDISRVVNGTTMPVEVFIHGALCVAYSGQCLTSEALGGRSANRGQCAQACRLPYDLVVDGQVKDLGDKAYLLSPHDLAGHDLVGELAAIGVTSLKIEGRLKSAQYVAATTQTYRAALDDAAAGQTFQISSQQQGDLEQTFSRGFTHGFLSGVNHQELVTARFPKSRGRQAGVVKSAGSRGVVIEMRSGIELRPGDGIVFDEGRPDQAEQGGRIFAVRPRGRNQLEIELATNSAAVSPGAIVWKTDDPVLRKRLEQSYSRDEVVHRIPIDCAVVAHAGKPLALTWTLGIDTTTVTADTPLQRANKFPFTAEAAREQLDRLGDTPFALAALHADIAGEPMVPKSVLNELRRRGIEQISEARQAVHRIVQPNALAELRSEPPSSLPSAMPGPRLTLLVRSIEQLQAALALDDASRPAMVYCDFEDIRKYRDAVALANAAAMPVAVATLRIIKPGEEGFLRQIAECMPDAILVRSLSALVFYSQNCPSLQLIGDYSLNVANDLTARIFRRAGLQKITPSYDLNWKQMAAMFAAVPPDWFEIVVHQHMPMFHMEHCVFAHTLSNGKDFHDCGRPCERHQVSLKDRVGEPHPLLADVGCRNTVYNAQSQSAAEYLPAMLKLGLASFRVEMLRENPSEVAPLLQRYSDLIHGKADAKATVRSLRVLNRLGVTTGTLDHD